jgi:hypothetical protein
MTLKKAKTNTTNETAGKYEVPEISRASRLKKKQGKRDNRTKRKTNVWTRPTQMLVAHFLGNDGLPSNPLVRNFSMRSWHLKPQSRLPLAGSWRLALPRQ